MDKTRKIRKVIKGRPVLEGAGVHLKRVFGFNKGPEFDPFLLLDDFRADDPRDYSEGLPLAPPPRDRDDHLHPGRKGRARGQHGKPGA